MVANYQIKRKDILFIFIILILALLLRALYFMDYKNIDIYHIAPHSDSYAYFYWAKDISSGDILGSKVAMKWPLYAYFLGLLFKVSKDSVPFVYIFQFVLGAINCVLVYFIARRIFNEAVAFIAALLCVWYGLFIFYEGLLTYTTLSLFLNSLLFLFILHIQNHPTGKNLFWAGIFLGICTITLGNIVIFGILAVIWFLWQKRLALKILISRFLLFLLGLSIVVGSVTLRNYLVKKDIVLVSGSIGLNFYIGNNPENTKLLYLPRYLTPNEKMFQDAKIIAEGALGRKLKPSEVSSFWFNKSIDFIKNNPGSYLKLLFIKFMRLFQSREPINDGEYAFIKDNVGVYKIMFLDLRLIMPFAFLGMLLGLKRPKETAPLYLILVTLSVGITLFFIATRYRMTIVPYLCIFASFGIYNLWNFLKEKRFLKFALVCGFVLILDSLFYGYGLFNRERSTEYRIKKNYFGFNNHLRKAWYYLNTSDYQQAMQEAELALQLQPDNIHALLCLGKAHYHMNDFKIAEEEFKEVIKIFPLSFDAYYNLGLLYNRQNRFYDAKEVLEKAVHLDPEDTNAHFELGKCYKSQGELEKAKEEFSLALKGLNRWRIEERAIIEKELGDLIR
jgi:hypothetical protein